MLDYNIINTGSSGNAVRIENVMIDCGVSYKYMKESLYQCKYLLLTHIHSDHIKPATLKRIKQEFPKITIIGNYEVHQHYDVDIVCNAGFETKTKDYTFVPFEAKHDVICYGYTWQVNDQNIIYCTDTWTLENAPDLKYDYLFLESNYDEKKINAIKNAKKQYGYDVKQGAQRHLSTQQCKAFYYTHRRSKESPLIELHQSSRFY